jgi:hypothetical protein
MGDDEHNAEIIQDTDFLKGENPELYVKTEKIMPWWLDLRTGISPQELLAMHR